MFRPYKGPMQYIPDPETEAFKDQSATPSESKPQNAITKQNCGIQEHGRTL